MKRFSIHGLLLSSFFLSYASLSSSPLRAESFSIANFNEALPVWGVSWAPGSDAAGGYYPSFYTGFAPRSSFPKRIHVKLARGNQTRVSVVLDDQTVRDYLFDLAKRYEFYRAATSGSRPIANLNLKGRVSPQLELFGKVLESEGVLSFVERVKAGQESELALYKQGLQTMNRLNPNRVFFLKMNLTHEFLKWKSQVREMLGEERDTDSFFEKNPAKAIIALNSLLFGRVNLTEKPSANLLAQLAATAELTYLDESNDDFVLSVAHLFLLATGDKFQFSVLNEKGALVPALDCKSASHCYLIYPEFTAIYPTGSVKSQTRDQFGNSIPDFATPGLWNFLNRSGGRGVDNIRDESYYGWAPKMDYEDAGNGFHNPAVRFRGLKGGVKSTLAIPSEHDSFWSVMRGGVSHGCSRLPLGHVWEMRHIFPVVSETMTEVYYFGSDPRDFDVYDVNGDGTLEVMGVEYLISYDLQSASGLGKREGANLEIGASNKLGFYEKLYGSRNVFTVRDGNYEFISPSVSLPSYLDFRKKKIQSRLMVKETIPLFEMPYERDKVQFFLPITKDGLNTHGAGPLSKRIVRLLGRVRGCAPSTNKETCGEAAFDREAAAIWKEAR